MYQFWRILLTASETLGLIVGLAILRPPLALTPPTEISALGLQSLDRIQSLEELERVRDRLLSKIETTTKFDRTTTDELVETVQTIEIKIYLEQQAKEDLAIAMNQAVDKAKGEQPSLDLLQETESLWLKAIAQLKNTVCQVSNSRCRYWRGDAYPASAASLIKILIAIALMQKVTSENISLDTTIEVSRGNYTEDPEGANIWSGREHTLRELLLRMLDRSSNIATNQLIDYLGRDYINQVLRDRGLLLLPLSSTNW